VSQSNAEFARLVSVVLRKSGVRFSQEPLIGGVRPDFVIETAPRRFMVVEAKAWEPDQRTLGRAEQEARYLAEATGASKALIVLPSGPSKPEAGYVRLAALPETIFEWLGGRQSLVARAPDNKRRAPVVFAAMPFAPAYNDTYWVAMLPACRQLKAECLRVNHEDYVGDVPKQIKELIRKSAVVIGDVSESKPNVLFEIGFAQGHQIPVVQITSTDSESLPFDVRNDNTIVYTKGGTHDLKRQLVRRLRPLLPSVAAKPKSPTTRS
jgi:hypothetical protein